MAEIVYRSGPDYDNPDNPTLWQEEGKLPLCVDFPRPGDFVCRCGKHRVHIEITNDPLDGKERMSSIVTLISE